jgi:PEGA domain/Tetratricopeptide repeat
MVGLVHRVRSWAFLVAIFTSVSAFAGPAEDYVAGVSAFQSGNYERAATLLDASMKAKPSAKTALYLGNAHLKLGQLEAAKEAFEILLKLEPNHPKKTSVEVLIRSIEARAETKVGVESTPPGAKVFIDSEAAGQRGVTPMQLSLSIGRHKIIVTAEGYDTEVREEVLEVGKPLDIKINMTPKGCELSMSVTNASVSAAASVDSRDAITLPTKLVVRAGEHKVRFIAKGFDAKDEVFRCDGFAAGALSPTLLPETGRLTVSDAPGTVVKVDGKVVSISKEDATRGIGLAPGRHEISVSSPDEPTRTTIIDVRAGESIALGSTEQATRGGFPNRTLYLGLLGGGNITLSDWRFGGSAFKAQNGSTRFAPGSSGVGGIRAGFQISSRFALETEIAWMGLPNEKDFSHALSYDLNLLFHILTGKWTPFVEVGGGVYQVIAGNLGSDVSPRGHLGLGVRGRISKAIALRAEVRDVISRGFETAGSNNLELFGGLEFFVF